MESFGPIAPHYDVLMANVPYDSWAGYYRLLLSVLELDPDRILDACCGTGTVAELLTVAGYQVSGFDLSAAMIDQARAKAAAKGLEIPYWVADATGLDLGQTFEGVYSFFDSFNYITTLEGFRSAVARVAAHLEPGGSFIFDLNTAYAFEAQMFDQRDRRARAKIQYEWQGSYCPESRLIEVNMTFWRDGQEFKEVHRQRAHSDEEVRQALEDGGFTSVRSFDSYTLDKPRKRSDRIHYCALLD
ncbi:MAG: class I SAM-dependent methyltransferase [Fimbriimonadaceae bacterium]|jgi:SAM-dependent methyltransferase|nr:class I SAM-dependent methyltransferase [Fimbriimonadaceae bacterium]